MEKMTPVKTKPLLQSRKRFWLHGDSTLLSKYVLLFPSDRKRRRLKLDTLVRSGDGS